MISIDFCEKMSHANTRLDVFRRGLVSTPAIFFPRKPDNFTLFINYMFIMKVIYTLLLDDRKMLLGIFRRFCAQYLFIWSCSREFSTISTSDF